MTRAMSQPQQPTAAPPAVKDWTEKPLEYIPLGESQPISLSIGMVRRFIAKPTKKGVMPGDADLLKFCMLCKSGQLNPWTKDVFLIGYDGKDDEPATFEMVTAVQSLIKRAEIHPQFDGLEQGVIVKNKSGELIYRDGDFFMEDEILLGGWSRLHRKDRKIPFYDAVKLATFNSGRSRWKDDPGGMIVKCAQASVLRTAFPTQVGGMYIAEEFSQVIESIVTGEQVAPRGLSRTQVLAGALPGATAPSRTAVPQPPPGEQAAPTTAAPADASGPNTEPPPSTGQESGAGSQATELSEEEQKRQAWTEQTHRKFQILKGQAEREKLYADLTGPDAHVELSTEARQLVDGWNKEAETRLNAADDAVAAAR